MTHESELERLETTVAGLLEKYSKLKEANAALKKELGEKQSRVSSLETEIEEMQTQRGDVSARVGKLLDQIDQWQQDEEDSDADFSQISQEEASEDELSAESRQGSLFSS